MEILVCVWGFRAFYRELSGRLQLQLLQYLLQYLLHMNLQLWWSLHRDHPLMVNLMSPLEVI